MVLTQSEAFLVSGSLKEAARDLREMTSQNSRMAELMDEMSAALRMQEGIEVRSVSNGTRFAREVGQTIPVVRG